MTQNEGAAWVSRGAADNEQVINSRGGFFFFNVLHLHSRLPQRQSAALWSTNECRRLIGHWTASGGALHSLKVVFGHLDQHVAFTCIRSCAINSSLTRLLLAMLCDRSLLNLGKALKLNKESSAGCNASWWNVIRKCCKLRLCREQQRGKVTEVSTDKVFMCWGGKKLHRRDRGPECGHCMSAGFYWVNSRGVLKVGCQTVLWSCELHLLHLPFQDSPSLQHTALVLAGDALIL